jgi:hypothetical protein
MSGPATLKCAECGEPLYIGQPMSGRRREYHAHVGCSMLADIRARYGGEALRRAETLPPLRRAPAARAA